MAPQRGLRGWGGGGGVTALKVAVLSDGMWKCASKCVMIYIWLRFERVFGQMLFVSINLYIHLMSTKIMFISSL